MADTVPVARASECVVCRERLHHLGDALADQVLEIARLENAQNAVGNVLRQFLLEPSLERGRQVIGKLIDLFGGGENLLRRLRGAGGHGVELMRDARHIIRLQSRITTDAGGFARSGCIGRRWNRRCRHQGLQRGQRLDDLAVVRRGARGRGGVHPTRGRGLFDTENPARFGHATTN